MILIQLAGGTAGLVVAGRLAENPDVRILVIEAGQGQVFTALVYLDIVLTNLVTRKK